MSTFLGMPTAPRGVGHLRGDEPFPAAARQAVNNAQLRHNLTKATTTIRVKRAAVTGELPDWEELRARPARPSRRIRWPTWTGTWRSWKQRSPAVAAPCTGPRDANQIVTSLVQATGAGEVVRVKSLATDEIGLNDALAAAGIAAWETDLAELIVQLGHDRPSHILVPAIHRNRAEIREIFAREMAGIDPAPPMNRRHWLRQPGGTCAARAPGAARQRPRWPIADRRRRQRQPAVRIVTVRRVLRRLPGEIDIPELLVHLRGRHVEAARAAARPPSVEAMTMAAASWVMASPRRLRAAQRASRAGRVLGHGTTIGMLTPPLAAWTRTRDAPSRRATRSGNGGSTNSRTRRDRARRHARPHPRGDRRAGDR
jgi:L-lactate utilization protein LutB